MSDSVVSAFARSLKDYRFLITSGEAHRRVFAQEPGCGDGWNKPDSLFDVLTISLPRLEKAIDVHVWNSSPESWPIAWAAFYDQKWHEAYLTIQERLIEVPARRRLKSGFPREGNFRYQPAIARVKEVVSN
jgi:hypothetical protein